MFAYTKLMQAMAAAGVVSATDPYFNLTTLLLPGNGTNGAQNNTFLDSSSNNFTITRNGNTTQGTFSPFSQTGWSNFFDGTDDYLSVSYTATNFGTSDFTIECWVYYTSRANYNVLLDTRAAATANPLIFGIQGTTGLLYWDKGAGDIVGSIAVPLNQWSHVAISRASGTVRLFVDGVQAYSAADSANLTGTSTGTVNIGTSAGGSGDFIGYISNYRVVKGTGVYSGAFTPPTSPLTAITNTSLLTCQSNRFIDNSNNAFAITVNGTPSVQAFSPFAPTSAYSAATNGGSGYFDGSGDYLTTPSSANLALTSTQTIEFWFYATAYPTAGDSTVAEVINNNMAWGTNAWGLNFGSQLTYSNKFMLFVYPSLVIAGSVTPSLNCWNHFALVTSGGVTTMYQNGVSIGSWTGVLTASSANSLAIGNRFPGYISGLRVLKGSAQYTSAFTPPTAPPTAITNTQLLLNYTNAGITDATAKNVLETVGNAQISTTQSKFGGSSMYFDGVGDRLVGPSTQNTAFRTGDFTIEFWAYPTSSTSTFRSFIDTRSGSVNTGISIWQNGTSLEIYGSAQQLAATSALTVNAWQHIAVTRASNTVRAFVNGTQVGSSYTNSNDMTDTRLVIADDNTSTYPFVGYLDDFRITKGYARYTANFTAPTAAFALQ